MTTTTPRPAGIIDRPSPRHLETGDQIIVGVGTHHDGTRFIHRTQNTVKDVKTVTVYLVEHPRRGDAGRILVHTSGGILRLTVRNRVARTHIAPHIPCGRCGRLVDREFMARCGDTTCELLYSQVIDIRIALDRAAEAAKAEAWKRQRALLVRIVRAGEPEVTLVGDDKTFADQMWANSELDRIRVEQDTGTATYALTEVGRYAYGLLVDRVRRRLDAARQADDYLLTAEWGAAVTDAQFYGLFPQTADAAA